MKFFIILFFPCWLLGQNGFGTIRGKVIDKETQLPLEGVSVQMVEDNKGIYTDDFIQNNLSNVIKRFNGRFL